MSSAVSGRTSVNAFDAKGNPVTVLAMTPPPRGARFVVGRIRADASDGTYSLVGGVYPSTRRGSIDPIKAGIR